jgi:aminopeptidase N
MLVDCRSVARSLWALTRLQGGSEPEVEEKLVNALAERTAVVMASGSAASVTPMIWSLSQLAIRPSSQALQQVGVASLAHAPVAFESRFESCCISLTVCCGPDRAARRFGPI